MQWLSNLLLNHWSFSWILGWGGLGTLAVLGTASYFLGLSSVLKIIASIIDILSPLFKGLAEAFVEYTTVLYAGLKVVLNSWSAVLLVASLVTGAWAYGVVPGKIQNAQCQQQVVQCKKQIQVYIKRVPAKPAPFWPWE